MSGNKVKNFDEVVVKLLAKIAFSQNEVAEIVAGTKQNKTKWLTTFNLCDGEKSQKELCEGAGVDKGSLSRAIKIWHQAGIIYYLEDTKYPKAVTYIEVEETNNE